MYSIIVIDRRINFYNILKEFLKELSRPLKVITFLDKDSVESISNHSEHKE